MRSSSFLLLLVGLVTVLPAALRAQDRRLAERLDPVTAATVQHLVNSARTSGLPTEPLVQKALEGSTMGASGDRIRTAVQGLLGQLAQAREALGSRASEAELTAGAGALRAGLPGGSLSQLHDIRSGQSLVVPISVLTDLVAEGVPPEQATREVFDLAREGRSDAEFVELRRRVQLRRGGTPAVPQPPERPVTTPAADPPSDR
ncbi:MAG TPA: hypothetical protein VHR41_12040 [Gemmatimonadales bacterium]|jgi:hypothetical protein|nr:hypothetical protein [Gemmatimonadales bacterium]